MAGSLRVRGACIGASLALGLAIAGCSNAPASNNTATGGGSTTAPSASTGGGGDAGPTGTFPTVNQPGVSPSEIKVAGVASTTNPLGGLEGTAFGGVKAYFEMVNSQGGVYGRKLVMDQELDDQTAKNKETIAPLLTADIFAVLPVDTLLFTGADDLVAAGIPTYGWVINQEWGGTKE